MSNYSKSAVRTVVPLIVGYLATLAANSGLNIKSEQLVVILTPIITAVYYLIVRGIEEKYPKAGHFLGVPAKPQYDVKKAVISAFDTVVSDAMPLAKPAVAAELNKLATPAKTSPAKKAPAKATSAAKKSTATKATSAPKKSK